MMTGQHKRQNRRVTFDPATGVETYRSPSCRGARNWKTGIMFANNDVGGSAPTIRYTESSWSIQ